MHILRSLAVIAMALSFAAPAAAHDYTIGSLKIVHPWTREPPAGAKVAGGFMTITNTGAEPDRLLGGTFLGAGRFEVHEMKIDGGVMRMRELAEGLEIKPGETVALKPGSYHVMMIDLTAPPKSGTRVKGTLIFARAGTIEVEYKVEAPGARDSKDGHAH